jgi:MFS family permease
VLIGARAVQGIGAALMYPPVLAVIQVNFTGDERAKAWLEAAARRKGASQVTR